MNPALVGTLLALGLLVLGGLLGWVLFRYVYGTWR